MKRVSLMLAVFIVSSLSACSIIPAPAPSVIGTSMKCEAVYADPNDEEPLETVCYEAPVNEPVLVVKQW